MFSFIGDTVLDPFAGTGTTAIASAMAGRDSISVDIEPRYVDLILTRIRKTVPDVELSHYARIESTHPADGAVA
jgi:site-specific DNA-methyltransferase (adenine-specific)